MRSKVWLEVDGRFAIGDGGSSLLKAIKSTGSLSEGARQLGWSYRHAWGYIRRAEQVLGLQLLDTRSGKGKARGASLTAEGESLSRGLEHFLKRRAKMQK